MVDVYIEAKIKGLGTIFSCSDSAFNYASKAVLEKSDELISARDLAYAQMNEADNVGWKRSRLCNISSYIKEGILYDPRSRHNISLKKSIIPDYDEYYSRKAILLRESLVLKNPDAAVYAHRSMHFNDDGYCQYTPEDLNIKEYLKEIGEENYFVIDYRMMDNNGRISPKCFGDNPLTLWLFQDLAKEYGKFLLDKNHSMKIQLYGFFGSLEHYTESLPIANQLLMNNINSPAIFGTGTFLKRNDLTVRGIKRDILEESNLNRKGLLSVIKGFFK